VSFLNRADPSSVDNQDAAAILSEVSGIAFSGVILVNRKAYAKAVTRGLSVIELSDSDRKAVSEIQGLYK
ncbi:hypothetical protein ACQ7B2_07520, partial [Escherichia coli]